MNVEDQINAYINSQPEKKRNDMIELHRIIRNIMPGCILWYLDGKNEENKTVSNPNIGYGSYEILYTNGTSKAFYQVGLSANTGGISIYIMGIKDKAYLVSTFGDSLGKASVTGYCIKFKSLKDINMDALIAVIKYGFEEKV